MHVIGIEDGTIYVGESYQNLSTYLPKNQVILLTDENVYDYYRDFVISYNHIVIPSGEEAKNWDTVALVTEQLLSKGADRNTFLVGMGGGVVTDITGFVASIFMRGLRFGFLPSSLLAQVDASLGGKNGINFGKYKNMLGVFRSPEFVICDATLLQTLPPNELRSGFGEIIKHALIRDVNLLTYLEKNVNDLLNMKIVSLEAIIAQAIQIKGAIVSKDWNEKGLRKQLNFGHTLGHAIENNSLLTHGEAVAVGMYWAALWSEQRGYLSRKEVDRIEYLLRCFQLPIRHEVATAICIEFVKKDKKKLGTGIDFVFLKQLGEAQIVFLPMEEVVEAIKKIQL